MTNPYAPPGTQEAGPERAPANKKVILRRLGALGMAYTLARGLLNSFPDLPTKVIGVGLMVVLIYGFLRGGRRYHLGIAIFMGLSIAVQVYFMKRVIAHPERLPEPLSPYPWLEFAVSVIPFATAFLCASALYLSARRSTVPGTMGKTA